MTEATTPTGVDDASIAGDDTGELAFLKSFMPEGDPDDASKRKPSEKAGETGDTDTSKQDEPTDKEETSDESPEDATETDGETKTDTEEKSDEKKYVEDDTVFVKIKVGDEELEVPVKDLKRLHGQEAALTRRSQEVAKAREEASKQQQHYTAGLQELTKRAEARANEYRQLDFMALARNPEVPPEQLTALQDEARKVFEEEHYLKNELSNVVNAAQKEQKDQLAAKAAVTVKELSDQASPFYIEGWGQKMYGDILSFAKAEGLDAQVVDNLVDSAALKILHMAMSFKQSLKKVPTKVVNKTAKKIVKTSSSPVTKQVGKPARQQETMKALRDSGSTDAAADAFLARWEDSPSD